MHGLKKLNIVKREGNKSKIKRFLLASIVIGGVLIATTSSIYAASHGFWYSMNTRVYGRTQFNLSNKTTTIKTYGNTFHRKDDKVTGKKLSYKVAMGRYSKNLGEANGYQKTYNCGKIQSGKYKVNMFVTSDNTGYARYVQGSGSIVQ